MRQSGIPATPSDGPTLSLELGVAYELTSQPEAAFPNGMFVFQL